MRNLAHAAVLAALATATLVPVPAEANPSSAWRTRNTGVDSEGQCTRRAFNAMKAANLDAKASGNVGVYGSNRDVAAYVICTNGGQFAVIFCANDKPNSGNAVTQTCDAVSRFMDK